MKKFLFLLLVAVTAATAWGQSSTPAEKEYLLDLKAIRALAENDALYQVLTDRFEALDSTLTAEEISMLYHARRYRPDYVGDYSRYDWVLKNLSTADEVREWCLRELAKNPSSLEVRMWLVSACSALDRQEEVEQHVGKYQAMLWAILSSGDGSSEAPFRVNCVPDEYRVVEFFELSNPWKSKELKNVRGNQYDVLVYEVVDEDSGQKEEVTLWFDISAAVNKMNQLFEGSNISEKSLKKAEKKAQKKKR